MTVQWGVSWGPLQWTVISVRNVFPVFLDILFWKSKVDHKHCGAMLIHSQQEILRLDVSMNELLLMKVLESLNDLDSNHNNSFEVELFIAFLEKLLQRGSQQVHNHDVVTIELTVVVKSWESDGSWVKLISQVCEELGLILKLRVFASEGLHFDSDCLFGFEVDCQMNFSEWTRINFVIELESIADDHPNLLFNLWLLNF